MDENIRNVFVFRPHERAGARQVGTPLVVPDKGFLEIGTGVCARASVCVCVCARARACVRPRAYASAPAPAQVCMRACARARARVRLRARLSGRAFWFVHTGVRARAGRSRDNKKIRAGEAIEDLQLISGRGNVFARIRLPRGGLSQDNEKKTCR